MTNITTETFYVTKYALTSGIWVVKPGMADITDDRRYLYVGRVLNLPIQVPERDFFSSLDEAKARVRQLVEKKLKSLDRQTRQLQKYEPVVKEWSRP